MKKKILLLIILLLPFLVSAKASNKESEDYANLIFFAYFEGTTEQEKEDYDYLVNHTNDFLNFYNGPSDRSFTNYLKIISYDKFHVKNIFPQLENDKIIPIKLTGIDISKCYKINLDTLVIDQVLKKYPNILNALDYNADGYIDNITIILKHRNGYEALSDSTFMSHKASYPGESLYQNKTIGTYNIVATSSIIEGYNEAGVLAHEFLHSIGYPDLYRSQNGDDHPVSVWDIMASANYGMSYPLAFLRSYVSNWLDIETITTSTNNLRLDLQSNPNGNQAYILKSPLNDYELFVVEYRKKSNTETRETLDRFIGDSGIIVYRVDTTVERLSNNLGKTGVYVFREHNYTNEKTNAYYAALSGREGRRNTIGSSDLSATINDGALTFSDGSNSGIVIKNVSIDGNDYMTLDVEIPKKEDFDLWTNTNFKNSIPEYNVAIPNLINYKNNVYSMVNTRSKIYTSIYTDKWELLNTLNVNSGNIYRAKVFTDNNDLYMSLATNKLYLYKWNNNNWTEIPISLNNDFVTYYDMTVINNKFYLAMAKSTENPSLPSYYSDNTLYVYEDNKFKKLGTYLTGFTGEIKISNIDNDIYIGTVTGSGQVELHKYSNNTFTKINEFTSLDRSFDIKTLNKKIYISLGADENNSFSLVTYDGNNFNTINTPINLSFPELVVSQGNLYVLGSNNNNLYVFAYNEHDDTFNIEGNAVDYSDTSFTTSLASVGNTIFVGIRRSSNGDLLIKKKELTNHLKSISVTPPTKRNYKVGETIDLTGLKVIATYTNGSKEVSDYIISDFETDNEGTYQAIVSYEGIIEKFEYTVTKEVEDPIDPEDPVDPVNHMKGDFNKNNTIDLTDILIELKLFFNKNATEEQIAIGDFNNDNAIDLTDILKMLKLFFNK